MGGAWGRGQIPQTRISSTKAENRNSHASFPPSTGGSENSGSVLPRSLCVGSVAVRSMLDSCSEARRGVDTPVASTGWEVARADLTLYNDGCVEVMCASRRKSSMVSSSMNPEFRRADAVEDSCP